MRETLIVVTRKMKAMRPAVTAIFLLKIKPAEKRLTLYTSSVKYTKNLPSLPSSRSQSGHRCLRDAVKCMSIMTRIIMTMCGTSTKRLTPKTMDMHYGLRIIYEWMCCRQKGHFIEIGLNSKGSTSSRRLSAGFGARIGRRDPEGGSVLRRPIFIWGESS